MCRKVKRLTLSQGAPQRPRLRPSARELVTQPIVKRLNLGGPRKSPRAKRSRVGSKRQRVQEPIHGILWQVDPAQNPVRPWQPAPMIVTPNEAVIGETGGLPWDHVLPRHPDPLGHEVV